MAAGADQAPSIRRLSLIPAACNLGATPVRSSTAGKPSRPLGLKPGDRTFATGPDTSSSDSDDESVPPQGAFLLGAKLGDVYLMPRFCWVHTGDADYSPCLDPHPDSEEKHYFHGKTAAAVVDFGRQSSALIQRMATPAHLCRCPRRYGEMRVVPLRNHSPSDNEVRRAKKLGCPVIKVPYKGIHFWMDPTCNIEVLPEMPLPDGGDPPALAIQDMEFDGRLDEDWKDVTVKACWVCNSKTATNYGGPVDGMQPYDPSFGTLKGSCGYGIMDKTAYPYWSVVGISTSSRFYTGLSGQGCGVECVDLPDAFQGRCITGSGQQSIVVMISDSCPQCEPDHLDIQALTFNKIAPIEAGRIDIRYRQVECVPPADINIEVDVNTPGGGWIRMYVEGLDQRFRMKGLLGTDPPTEDQRLSEGEHSE
eukprot:jgi/Astpho2/4481/fgenesh1_pg.00067_%23_63_t